jgi:cytochrome c
MRRKALIVVAVAALGWTVTSVLAQGPAQERTAPILRAPEPAAGTGRGPNGVGRAPTAREIAQMDISIGPAGAELPPGSGTATQGALVFTQRACSTCHGPTATEGPANELIGGKASPSSSYFPIVQWPYATMIWDFIHRAMPYDRPGRLTADETYALTAFLLFRNGIIQEDDVMDAKSLPNVRMPHREAYKPPAEPWKPGTPKGLFIKAQP